MKWTREGEVLNSINSLRETAGMDSVKVADPAGILDAFARSDHD